MGIYIIFPYDNDIKIFFLLAMYKIAVNISEATAKKTSFLLVLQKSSICCIAQIGLKIKMINILFSFLLFTLDLDGFLYILYIKFCDD